MAAAEVTSSAGARALQLLQAKMPDAVLRSADEYGEITIWVAAGNLRAVAELLRDDPTALYRMPICVTAVDWPDREPQEGRFDVVYQLRSLHRNDVCRLVVQAGEDHPHVPSLEAVWPGMDWHERECFDLFGIVFDGHHDLQRILLPVDWEGHPLRKDYVSFGEPVAFTHNLEWALPAAERPSSMPGENR